MYNRFISYFQGHTTETKSILWMLGACVLGAVMAVLTKHVAGEMHPLEMVFFRNLFAVSSLLPWVLARGIPHVKAANFKLYFSRSISSLFAMSMFFYAVSIIPITDAIAITFTVPLITTVLAVIFLGEKVGVHRVMALVIGFLGVVVVFRPGYGIFESAYLMVLASTIGWSISNILIKKLTRTDHPRAMVFVMMLIMTPLTFPGALYVWQPPEVMNLIWLFVLAVVTNEAQFCMNKAYKNTEMSVLMPFDFSRLIFTSILAYMFFAEVIDAWTLLGSLIIFSSSVYIVRREYRNRLKKKETPQMLEV